TAVEVGEAAMWNLALMPNHEASVRDLTLELPDALELSATDRAPSRTRKGEEVWEQQVRNLVSHRKVPGNIVREGYAEYRRGKLRLTAAGALHLGSQGYDLNSLYNSRQTFRDSCKAPAEFH
ncbi:MAG: hypothetical protein AB7O04_16260, partial [Hyphomonadaceae bacterium]